MSSMRKRMEEWQGHVCQRSECVCDSVCHISAEHSCSPELALTTPSILEWEQTAP